MRPRVLLVEDDVSLARMLQDNLDFEGFDVVWVAEGQAALQHAEERRADLVILDLGLPDLDGFEVVRRFRQMSTTPLIVLSARGEKLDKLRGLQLGADDYVTKPFDLQELFARMRAVLRRLPSAQGVFKLGDVTVDFQRNTAQRRGVPLHLTDRELQILRFLVDHQSRIVQREELLKEVWGYQDAPITRSVDHAIVRLRRKIEPNPTQPRYIQTVHGGGYRLSP